MSAEVIFRREGRKNITEILSNNTVRKISVISEINRPLRLRREMWALSEASKKGINVPEVLDFTVNDGKEIIILKKIEGVVLSFLPAQDLILLERVGVQMKKLNEGFSGFGLLCLDKMVGQCICWKKFLEDFVWQYGGNLVENGYLCENDLKIVQASLMSEGLDLERPYLLHRDIKLDNLIVDTKGEIWIVDWENVMLGDPLFDVAQFGASYGRNVCLNWLANGYDASITSSRYSVYEVVMLIGIIDFCCKYKINCGEKLTRLKKQIEGLSVC